MNGRAVRQDMAQDAIEASLTNDLAEITRLAETIEAFGKAHGLPEKVVFHVNLVLDELITNIISYGYPEEGPRSITVGLALDDGALEVRLEDDGVAFNPLADAREPDTAAALEDRPIGGLGVHFMKTFMDAVDYRREDGLNRLRMVKKLGD
ncbi:MAG: ATP-binding protein [Thalassobaculales bacterium]